MFLIDDGTPDLFKSLFGKIIHKSALEQVTGYYRYRKTLLLLKSDKMKLDPRKTLTLPDRCPVT